MAMRDKVLDAAADLVPVEAPQPLVDDETRRRIEDIAHRLAHQGADLEQYLQATGQDPQVFIDQVREGAARGVLADLALRAVVAQEEIEATDDEVDAEVERLAEQVGQKPEKLRRELARNGGLQTVRSDVARGKALQFLVDHSTVVDEEGNEISLELPADENDENDSEPADEATERSQP
jgi:trigger factor